MLPYDLLAFVGNIGNQKDDCFKTIYNLYIINYICFLRLSLSVFMLLFCDLYDLAAGFINYRV